MGCAAKDEAEGNDASATGSGSATDGSGDDGSGDDTTGGAALAVDCGVVPLAAVGADYTHALAVDGGLPPYAWLPTGGLPAGLMLDPATGTITGQPQESGAFMADISVTDLAGTIAMATCAIMVNEPLGIDSAIDPTDPSFCITGNGSLLDLVPAGSGDGSPIHCEFVGDPYDGRMPQGIAIDPETCQITGELQETRYGTWAFIVRGEQNGAQMFAPYCVTQGTPDFAYAVDVVHSGLRDGATAPIVRVFDPNAPLQFGEPGDPAITITHPRSCAPNACHYRFAYALHASGFDSTTFALADAQVVFDTADAPIGFTHGLTLAGRPVEEPLRTRPWVQHIAIDYCLSGDPTACTEVSTEGDGHIDLSIVMVPGR